MLFNSEKLNKFIWLGDPHVKKTNIEESYRLLKWVDEQAYSHRLPVVMAGDQYNDFGIARVEAVQFWNNMLSEMKSPVIALLGNHDANPDMSMNFMDIHSKQAMVVSSPINLKTEAGQVTLLPFYRSNEDFIEAMKLAASVGSNRIICHQEFNGCKYENGFYSPHGVDPANIPTEIELIVSGHIHKEQYLDKLWYPGTARHLTKSDAGENKGIFLIDISEKTIGKIPTPKEVCEPFTVTDIKEGDDSFDFSTINPERSYINLTGSSEFIKKALKSIPDGVKVKTVPTNNMVESNIKESEGIPTAFINYVMDYANKNGLGNKEVKVILDKIYEKCPLLKSGENV